MASCICSSSLLTYSSCVHFVLFSFSCASEYTGYRCDFQRNSFAGGSAGGASIGGASIGLIIVIVLIAVLVVAAVFFYKK